MTEGQTPEPLFLRQGAQQAPALCVIHFHILLFGANGDQLAVGGVLYTVDLELGVFIGQSCEFRQFPDLEVAVQGRRNEALAVGGEGYSSDPVCMGVRDFLYNRVVSGAPDLNEIGLACSED